MLTTKIKYALATVLVLFLAYKSVYFKKLSDVKAAAVKQFDPTAYARDYLTTKLLPAANKAPEVDVLLKTLKSDPEKAFKTDARALDIGNIRFFMVKGDALVTAVDENDVTVLTDDKQTVRIAMEYVFGNALRDASGLINVNDFTNTMDLNNISAEVNKIIRTEVLPPFKSKVKNGDMISFAGAFELNQEHINLKNIEVIPVLLKINN